MSPKQVIFDEGDDSEDEELRARKAMDRRLRLLQQRHNVRRTKNSSSLEGDKERLFAVLEDKGNGSILRGWRMALDQDGALEIGFSEFCRAMSSLGVQIDALKLFQGGDEPQTFKLQDLAPEPAALLSRFREWVKSEFSGPAAMFSALDPDQNGCITREQFNSGCKEKSRSFTDNELDELFNCIDFDDGGSVTPDEIVFLELDPATRDHEIFKLKMRSKFQRQRMLAFTYFDDGCRDVSKKHRRAQRAWHAEDFEKLPPLVCKKRVDKQQECYKKIHLARLAFMRHLRSQYSSEVRAWRRGLDPDCNFRITKTALRQYCRQHDLALDFTALWGGLDMDGDDSVALEEVTARAASELARFRAWAHEQFGSCAAVWDLPEVEAVRNRPHLNGRWVSDKKMRLGAVAEAMKALGWESAEGGMLYQSLDLYGCGFLSLPDFWWLDAWDPPEWLVEPPDVGELRELMSLVQAMYPQPLSAWRALLDKDSDNQVSWVEFLNACRKVKFHGNAGAAWRALDRDVSGTISLREWDRGSAELLGSFKRWCETHFGSVELAFKAMDKTGIGTLTLSELRSACKRLEWAGDVRMLFTCLGVRDGKDASKTKTLQLSDIAFIDCWVDSEVLAEAALEFLPGNTSALSSPKSRSLHRALSASSFKLTSGSPTSRRSAPARSLDIESSSLGEPQSGGSGASTPGAAGRSQHEKLHRAYHCMSQAKRNKPPGAPPPGLERAGGAGQKLWRSKSLPWLDKINLIDERYGQLKLAAG